MIAVENLYKTFKLSRQQRREQGGKSTSLDAVAGINFNCQPGRVFTLLGPNGAGKTTTLRMIATLMKPTSGSITIAGVDAVQAPRAAKSKMGFLTGTTKLYDRLTPNEVVKYYADLYGVEKDRFEQRRDALFSQLEINDFAGRRIGKLSTGMRQRVSIARTMIHDPEVIVFDEPTVGLDVLAAQSIVALIRQCKEAGKTIIFSTHIMGEVSLLSDDLAIIHRGQLCYCGRYEEFRAQMQHESLEAEFIRILQEEHA